MPCAGVYRRSDWNISRRDAEDLNQPRVYVNFLNPKGIEIWERSLHYIFSLRPCASARVFPLPRIVIPSTR